MPITLPVQNLTINFPHYNHNLDNQYDPTDLQDPLTAQQKKQICHKTLIFFVGSSLNHKINRVIFFLFENHKCV